MRFLFVIDHLRPEGTQRVLCQLAAGLTRRGHTIAVLCLNDSWDAALVAELRQSGSQVRILGKTALLAGYGVPAALAWMRRGRFDAVATMLFVADVVGRSLGRLAGIPRVISSIRARNVNYRLWQLLLVRATAALADAVVVNSRGTRVFAVAAEGARPGRLVYIPNGIDVAAYREPMAREALRAELGLAPTAPLIGAVGRLNRQKGLDLLLAALAMTDRDDAHLLLVGEGEERAPLQGQAQMLQLEDRVHFAGYRRDVPRLLGALDLYVHPARFEGMPNALLEAMAAACPIVATSIDGNGELIEAGRQGWLVPPEDPSALAGALREALDDRPEARRRGAAARERAARCFSLEAMVTAWEEVLRERP